ncbi:DUF4249 family protein [Spirosoma sp. HMF3257]|uniref:DUF4249 domain-containing protein n=2 Tax=Spirosoma telluris TaxID=2183553 RepID=A0A327NVS7_9BACT|nr:DUF4249 family protein [Spirosoma telluris]RAI78713.1 DUF4249 domain-containing protein [Spirosoma telluris]
MNVFFSPFRRFPLMIWLLFVSVLASCVDPEDLMLRGTVDVIVVDGTITNLAEPQVIRLNRSKADPLTGRPGNLPLSKATVEVIVDSSQVIAAHETQIGSYQLPSDFKGQIGHAYQLRFTLSEGTQYTSTQQVMVTVPSINRVYAQFNPTGLSPEEALIGNLRAGHDIYLDTQDPASERNYYRWDWKLWENEEWCRTCENGQYSINNVLNLISGNGLQYFETGDSLFEDCFYRPYFINQPVFPYWVYDYPCRTQCWAIFNSYSLNVFADSYINGGAIAAQKVAQIPFYQHNACLVEIRQAALTPSAYQFYKQVADQTQRTGGLADTPPTASIGNVRSMTNNREIIVGFFTASAVATVRYWLDRKDTQGIPPGLFIALKGREPIREPTPPKDSPPINIYNTKTAPPPYTATCQSNDGHTPVKPVGWRD